MQCQCCLSVFVLLVNIVHIFNVVMIWSPFCVFVIIASASLLAYALVLVPCYCLVRVILNVSRYRRLGWLVFS